MPGIEELLGKQTKDDAQPEEEISAGESPIEGENPLEKMDKISKAKIDKKGSAKGDIDSDAINEMLMTGDNTDGMFVPDEKKPKEGEPKIHEDEDESMKKKLDGKATPQGKYIKNFKSDLLKNPDEYKLMTPKGEMTVAEAIRKGYNPITKRFESNHDQEKLKEKHLSQLNDADRDALEKFTSPSNAQVAPADAEKYGIKQNSPFIKQPEGGTALPPAMGQPTAMGGGIPQMGGGQPTQQGVPGGMPGAGGQADLTSLLGGGM